MKSMTAMNATRKQAGFTIIELVVVILLLGILTATALPRFMDVTDEAHDAVADAVLGGFTTGVALFRAQWVAESQPMETQVDEFDTYASSTGYPRSATKKYNEFDITAATSCAEVYNAILQPGGRPSLAAVDGLSTDALGDRETAIEGAAAGVDYVAVLERDNAAPTAATTSCSYYYVGQHKSGVASPANNVIPMFSYNFVDGTTTAGTFDLTAP